MTEEAGSETQELPEDTGKVDLTGLPDAERHVIGRRLGTLTKTVKELREQLDESAKASRVLFDEVKGIKAKGEESERQQILDGIRDASEEGDHEKVATLTDRLTRLNSNGKDDTPGAEKPTSAEPEKKKEPAESDLSEVMSSEDEARLNLWINEQDTEGKPVRPWLQEGHPQYKRAMLAAQAVMADDGLKPAEMMQEIDRIMGTSKSTPSPTTSVLSPGSPPRRQPTQKPKATPEQLAVAEAMGVKPDEYMAVVAGSEKYQDGTIVKVLELED